MRLNTLWPVAMLSLSIVAVGCGGGGGEPASSSSTPAASNTPAAAEPTGTASISGTIAFTGTPPAQPELNLDRDCRELHDGPVLAQNVVVNDNGTLRWVFVYVKEGLEGKTFATPTEPVEFDQTGCMYKPHVFGVQTNQPIKIVNSDPFLHNIHALPETNRGFNFGMPTQGMEKEQSFRVPEVMVRVKCDVHGWMSAYIGVLDHPFFSVSGEDGTFSIKNLPAGTYTIEAWHETYGTKTQTVTVGDGESATADFSFAAAS